MSDNTKIVVGLKGKDFNSCILDGDGELAPPKRLHLSYASYGYEIGTVWKHALKSTDFYDPKIEKELIEGEDKGSIYGIYIVGTWNGAIDLESIQEYIDEAKRIFKERTSQDGKVYLIGEQV